MVPGAFETRFPFLFPDTKLRSSRFFSPSNNLKNRRFSLDHFFCDYDLADCFLGWEMVHGFEEDLFEDHH